MSETIRVDDKFIKSFLIPIENVADKALLKIKDGRISSSVVAPETSIIFYAETDIDTSVNDELMLAIANVRKLRTHLELATDLSDNDELELDGNLLKYKSKKWRFVLHLLDESILLSSSKIISKKAIDEFEHSHSFVIQPDIIKEIVRMKSANKEAEKVYFRFEDDGIYADLTDHSKPNMDLSGIKITDKYTGDTKQMGCPILFDMIRVLSRYKDIPFKVKYADRGVFMFQSIYNKVSINYIISENTN